MSEKKETTEEITLTDLDHKRPALERLVTGAMDILAEHRDVSLLLYIKFDGKVFQATSEDVEELYKNFKKSQSQSAPQ